tara:strand:- start:10443 stop:11048 length:606 start_codon:yes stop_codon:yes gene_type:complete
MLGEGTCKTLTVIYSEGEYENENSDEVEKPYYVFTDGKWKTIAVPNFQGVWNPENNCHYIVSVGFEGRKTLRSVSEKDPDKVSILFPRPGFKQEYVDTALSENHRLFEKYCIPERNFVYAHAADAISAWRQLSIKKIDKNLRENTYFLCCGTKPHAIGIGLRALNASYPFVCYNIPEEHKFNDTFPSGVFWKYVITDLAFI